MRTAMRLYKSRRYEGAVKELHALDDEPSENPEIAYYLGLCYTQLRRYDDALLYLEQVVTSETDLVHIYQSRMLLSYIYTITGRYKLAEFELDALIEGGYESAQVFSAYGHVAYESGRIDDALEYLQKALTVDPDNANAMNSLGYILAEENRDLEYALSLCRKAVAINEDNPAYLDSLGWVHHKLGNNEEARGYLRKAMSLSGGETDIATHMREVMHSRT